jgi:hypothetical protein
MPRHDPIPLGGTFESKPKPRQVPFPGLIDGHHWAVREGGWPGFIDRRDDEGRMVVPLDDTPAARKMRLRLQAHVRHTPNVDPNTVDPQVSGETIEACEDGRVIQLMNRREEWLALNTGESALPETLYEKFSGMFSRLAQKLKSSEEEAPEMQFGSEVSLIDGARLLAQTRGYNEGHWMDSWAKSADLDWLVEEVDGLHHKHLGTKSDPTFEDTVAYARELEQRMQELEDQLLAQSKIFQEADMGDHAPPRLLDEDPYWGEMTTEEAPLTQRLKTVPSWKIRATDMGCVPRYMHRLTMDQRVFGRRRKKDVFQGTVLIDHSGSMSLSAHQVDQILTRWPAVTIATYAGDGYHGVLRVVARDGRRAEGEWLSCPSEGENTIDGPALDWLNKQRGPRVWISDGLVTGTGATSSPGLRLDAFRKVSKGRVKRVPNVQQLLGY